jgi:hypothetical protein
VVFVSVQWAVSEDRHTDLCLVASAIGCGLVIESLLAVSGWARHGAAWPSASLAPAWILALWSAFAMTVNHSLKVLKRHLLLASMVGAIGGPLAYLAASRVAGAITLDSPARAIILLAVGWALAMTVLVIVARRAPRITSSPYPEARA